jgi:hypothetical protein
MATMTTAQAVLEHAHEFYDVDNWYIVAECWDLLAIAEELDRQEDLTGEIFELDVAAIAHFDKIIRPDRTRH